MDRAIFAPNKRLAGDLIGFVLHVSCEMMPSNFKFRRLAAVETHHDSVMKQGLRFKFWTKKLATPEGNSQLGENCPNSKAQEKLIEDPL